MYECTCIIVLIIGHLGLVHNKFVNGVKSDRTSNIESKSNCKVFIC